MIEINLLPEERRKKQEHFHATDLLSLKKLQNIPVKTLILLTVGIFMAIQMVLSMAMFFSKLGYASVNKKYAVISPKKKIADELKSQADIMKRKVAAIDELMVNRFGWSRKLNDLSDCMIPGIWLTQLEYDEKMGERTTQSSGKEKVLEKTVLRYLIISGYALNSGGEGTAVVGKFIKTLKSNSSFYSDFKEIELGSIKGEKLDDQDVMNFKITCLFPDTVKARN